MESSHEAGAGMGRDASPLERLAALGQKPVFFEENGFLPGLCRAALARKGTLGALATRQVPLGALGAWLVRRRVEVLLAFGILLRLRQYLADRTPWLDEMSLAGNITGKSLAGLFGPLASTQLAPPGFLVVEWLMARILGPSAMALRLVPLLCGIASLFLAWRLAALCLRPSAVAIAIALLAVSEDLVYYASEIKQYSSDVTVALACTLAAVGLVDRGATAGRLAGFAALGVVAVWFSHPAAFVLAGLGSVLIASAVARRDWRTAGGLALAALVWLVSFSGVYLVAQEQLGHRRDMWRFWDFAFPPMPPASPAEAARSLGRLLYLFVNPLDFHAPLGPRLSPLPAAACFALGAGSMLRRRQGLRLGLLVAPLVVVLLASWLRLYPFHGRLLLFLVPSLLLLVAEGAAWVGETASSRVVWTLLLAALLLLPTLRALSGLVEPPLMRFSNPRGDLRLPTLDPARYPF
jgi:hypothetical protein